MTHPRTEAGDEAAPTDAAAEHGDAPASPGDTLFGHVSDDDFARIVRLLVRRESGGGPHD